MSISIEILFWLCFSFFILIIFIIAWKSKVAGARGVRVMRKDNPVIYWFFMSLYIIAFFLGIWILINTIQKTKCQEACQIENIRTSISANFSINPDNQHITSQIDIQNIYSKDEQHKLALFMIFKDNFYNDSTITLSPITLQKKQSYWSTFTKFSSSKNEISDNYIYICFSFYEAWICDVSSFTSP
jgi:hypothetical protein